MRAIDADALIETINRHCYPVQHDMTSIEPGMTRIGILQVIQEQPTVEPERKRGRWIEDGYNNYKAVCSECGEPCGTYVMGKPRDNFCKWCGAKMEAET